MADTGVAGKIKNIHLACCCTEPLLGTLEQIVPNSGMSSTGSCSLRVCSIGGGESERNRLFTGRRVKVTKKTKEETTMWSVLL